MSEIKREISFEKNDDNRIYLRIDETFNPLAFSPGTKSIQHFQITEEELLGTQMNLNEFCERFT